MKIAIYVRVSTDKQELENQLKPSEASLKNKLFIKRTVYEQ